MRDSVKFLLGGLACLAAVTVLAAPRCHVEPFTRASLPGGTEAQMSVVNDVRYCAITNYGVPEQRQNPAEAGKVLVAPAHGSAVFVAPQIRYTPEPGYVGADEFRYEAYARAAPHQPVRLLVTVRVTVRAP